MESPIEEGWEIVDYYPTLEGDNQEQVAEKSRLRWVVDKGFNVGKKLVITGVVISSVPFVLPPLVVISALGFAFSVPYGVVFASYVGTQKLMSKLLPSPEEVDKGLRIGYADYDSGDKIQKEREGLVGDTSEYDKGEKEIRTEYDDGGGNRDEVREEQEGLSEDTFENDNLENVELGGADEEEKEVRIEYDDDDGGGGDRDEIREEKEGLARDTLENDYPNNGGFDEVENDVQIEYDDDGNRGEIQETQEGSARDTLENDNPNQVELVSGVDEEEESGQHSIEKGKDENPSFNVEKTGDEHAREQVQNDELIGNERKEEERVEFSTETNRNGRGVFVENEGEQNAMDREKKEEKVEEIITETSKIEDEKKQEVDSKESGKRRKKKKNGGKRKEPVKEPLQETKISSENKEKLESDEKFAMEERSRNESISRPGEADSTNGGVVEEKIEVQTDKDTGVNNNESRVIVDDGDHSLEVAEHDKETLVDIKEKEKDAALHSEEESIRDAKVWEKIDAIRVIVGFKAPRRDSYYKELKALYLFTGIEAPSPFFDPGDFEEFDIKQPETPTILTMAEYMQLISDDREFHVSGLQGFMNSTNFHVCGLSYSVVAIIGPQSSGKSTLLNHLFHTQFPVMNAFLGRSKTTRGIWLAKADAVQPFTLVMDLEGTDGREKEDDTAFEKQSCLFAFAVADIVLINMWCHDIGRQQAANVPLLETVFKAMLQLFSHRKTTLLFVIRDREETPLHILESILTEDILKIWEAVPKPPQHKDTPLSDFFNVEVIALCNKKEKEFKEQVDEFRHKCFHSPSPADRRGVVPASGFSLNAENIWKKIKENKDLDLPAIKVLVSSKRCEEIADNKFNCLESSKEWLALKSAVAIGKVTDFRRTGSSILNKYLSEYGSESMYYTEHVRKEKREHLRSKALQLLGSCYINMTKHLRSDAFEHFKTEVEIPLGRGEGFADSVVNCKQASMLRFDEECSDAAIENANWDASEVRAGLCRDIEDHASRVRDQKLSQVVAEYENKLCEALNQPVKDAFKDEVADTWVYIRSLLQCKSNESALAFTSAISGFRLDQSRVDNMVHDLEEYAMQVVVTILREEAQNVLALMINRFHTTFNRVETTGREDISAITREVHLECLRLLSTMAVLRLDDTTESIETVILSELMDRNDAIPSQNMASTTWNQVPPEKTLITPAECNELWRQFKAETESRVKQAQSAKVLAARQRCQEIVDDKFNRLTSSENQDWQSLIRAAETGQVSDFRQIGTSIFNRLLDEYTLESENYEEDVREEIRQHLKSTTLKLLEVRYIMVVDYLRSAALEHFKTEVEISVGRGEGFTYSVNMCKQTSMLNFDRGCAGAVIEQANWHASGADLLKDIEDHAHVVGQEKLSQVLDRSKNKLCEALSQPVEALFKAGDADTWASIRGLVRSESDAAALEFSSAIWGFELSQSRVESMVAELKEYAKLVVERKSRDVAQMVDLLMAKRFHAFFDVALSTGRDNISAITEEAQLECLKLLSTMAVIRLDYDSSDNVKGILIHELMRRSTPSQNMASTTWDQVPPEKTLIKPKECVNLWKRFKAETESRSNQALSASKSMSTFTKVLIVGGVALVCVGVGAAVVYFIWGAGPLVTAVSTVGRAAVSTAGGVRAAVSAVGGVSASAARGATSAARSVSAAAVATTSAARTVAAAAADVAAAVADVGGAAATVVAALMVLAELKKSSAVRES